VKLFLIVTFVYVFLILTESYVTDFLLYLFDLISSHSPNESTVSNVIRVVYLAGITIAWLCYRYSWKKKYTASLDSKSSDTEVQAAINRGRGAGIRLGIIVTVVGVVYVVLRYFEKI